jgi:hypothetical protein
LKSTLYFILLIVSLSSNGQSYIKIDKNGQQLKSFYLSQQVETHWIAGSHIDWETGETDNPGATNAIHTHCSAFAAAVCKRLNIYILRPPEHNQILLANAQYAWLSTPAALDAGWKLLTGNTAYEEAQSLANQGYVVLAICENTDKSKPGHVALVMPSEIAINKLEESGPMLIMAGTHNYNKIALKGGFRTHITEWPEHSILFYYNKKFE